MRTAHDRPVPEDVTDIMLWRLATEVTAQHQPDPVHPGRCTNLRCTGESYPCLPARDAARALRAATGRLRVARGRARVPAPVRAAAERFTGWFRPTRPAHVVAPLPHFAATRAA